MFADWVKIALKTALVATIMVGLWLVFANVQIPAVNFTYFTQAVSTGLAVMYYWFPVSQVLFPVFLTLLAMEVALFTFKYAMIAVKWLMKVNE